MSAYNVLHQMMESTFATPDPGDGGVINIDRYGQLVELASGTTETRTLSRPLHPGILCLVRMVSDGGDVTVTITGGCNVAGNTAAVFADVGDQLLLVSVSTSTANVFRWEILVNTGSISLS
jgi:hypothetical protein